MSEKISKTNVKMEFLSSRLDEIRMSDRERLKAKAQLAQAEAILDTFFAIGRGLKALFKSLLLRPLRRLTTSIG